MVSTSNSSPPADIIGLANFTGQQDFFDRPAVIQDMQPLTAILAALVQGHFLPWIKRFDIFLFSPMVDLYGKFRPPG
jgi:hypothetical protein